MLAKVPPSLIPFAWLPVLHSISYHVPGGGWGGVVVVVVVPVLAKGAALLKHPSLRKLRHHHEK